MCHHHQGYQYDTYTCKFTKTDPCEPGHPIALESMAAPVALVGHVAQVDLALLVLVTPVVLVVLMALGKQLLQTLFTTDMTLNTTGRVKAFSC